jgi:O-antigen/teichoic acid export membrane protein
VIFTTTTSAFVGFDKTEYNAITVNIQAIAKAIVSVAFVLVGLSVAGAVLGHVASYIVSAGAGSLLLFLILRQKQDTQNNSNLAEDLKNLLRYGTPLFVSLVLTGFIPLYQNVILAMFTTDADIGNYKAATNFATLITVLAIPITTALLPAFSKLDSSSLHKVKKFFKLANKYTAMIILPVTFLIIIFSSEIVQIIYGSIYQSAPSFLAIYCLLYLLVGLGYLTLTSFFNGLGETKSTLKMSLITFLTLVILSPALTSTYSVFGLIIAFLVASAVGNIYGSYVARANFKMEFDTKSVAKIYLISMFSSLVPLAMLQLSPFPRLFNVVTGALLYMFLYITLAPLTGIVNRSELQAAKNILQNIKPLAPIAKPLLKYENKILNHRKQPQEIKTSESDLTTC